MTKRDLAQAQTKLEFFQNSAPIRESLRGCFLVEKARIFDIPRLKHKEVLKNRQKGSKHGTKW